MNDQELAKRINDCRSDYELQKGKSFAHFFCPILFRDEHVVMCRGHIVLDAFSGSEWVPQRKDVDNFYGTVAERALVTAIEDRNKDLVEVLMNPQLRRKLRPTLEFQGKKLEYYLPQKKSKQVKGHKLLKLAGVDGTTICDLAIKTAAHKLIPSEGNKIEIVVQRDFRPPVVAAMLKAAHLTLFQMLGYKHVFSPTGIFAGDILGKFFDKYKTPRNVTKKIMDDYFGRQSNMVAPLYEEGEQLLRGTATDKRLIVALSATLGPFAIGVVVKAGSKKFCVLLPTDSGKSIDIYFSFLKEPPPSIVARFMQFCPKDEKGEARWEVPAGEPMRISLNQSLPKQK